MLQPIFLTTYNTSQTPSMVLARCCQVDEHKRVPAQHAQRKTRQHLWKCYNPRGYKALEDF